ncbi:magnesium/cobalt transporter CorA [bacterium]|nr:magnesium/cobalt transporter CorA [bacterium]
MVRKQWQRITRNRIPRLRKRKEAGLPPGTVIYTGESREGTAELRYLRYTPEVVYEEVITPDDLPALADREGVQWLRVEGVHDVEMLERIGAAFGLHALTLEDISNASHRPKFEQFEQYLFIVLRHLRDDNGEALDEENICLLLIGNLVLSFSDSEQKVFAPNKERIGAANGRFRARGADYLLYSLIDSVVDHYVLILENMDDAVEELEEAVLGNPSREIITRLHDLRRSLTRLRRAVLPLRDVVMQLQREETEMVGSDITMFLHDVQDHLNQVLDMIESDRETIGGLIELYMTHESNRMNEVMKVLTVIATVFIPLTFIAGIYGMNFEYMPELRTAWGYPAVLTLMFGIAAGMFLFFRRRGWL